MATFPPSKPYIIAHRLIGLLDLALGKLFDAFYFPLSFISCPDALFYFLIISLSPSEFSLFYFTLTLSRSLYHSHSLLANSPLSISFFSTAFGYMSEKITSSVSLEAERRNFTLYEKSLVS